MLDNRRCAVNTPEELNREIRDILALESVGRGSEIGGTLHVDYLSESVKQASLVSELERRGVSIIWRKQGTPDS